MSDESPLDRFKSVLTGASRAVAHDAEVEVNWTADNPAAIGRTFRVPMPGRSLPPAQAAQARGYADSFALKLRHHDDGLHNRHAPAEPVARACYDAIEAVRYEAIGSRDYAGMRGNLDAACLFQIIQHDERLGDGAATGQNPVVAQEQKLFRGPKVGQQPFLFIQIQRQPFVVVIADQVLVEQRRLRNRQQTPRLRRNPGACGRVGMGDAQ